MTEDKQSTIVWEDVSSSNVNEWYVPEEGKAVTGVVVDIFTYEDTPRHVLDVNGSRVGLPSHSVLVNILRNVKVGELIKVECTGLTKNAKKQDMYTYNVQRAKTEGVSQ